MFGKSTQKLFGALVIVSLLLTSVGSSRGATAATPAAAPPAVATASRVGTAMAVPTAATPIDPSPYGQYNPKLVNDSAGNLFVVWQDYREGQGSPHIRFAYQPVGGAWQPSAKLDPASTVQWRPTLAVDGSGNAFAAWQDRRSGYDQIYFAFRPAGGVWGAGQVISPTLSSEPQGTPALAVSRRGEAVIFWAQGRCCVNPSAIYAAGRPAGGSWSRAERVGQGHPSQSYLAAAFDDWGRAYAIWLDPSGTQVSFATRPAGGVWSTPQNIRDSATGTVMHLSLAVDSAGNAHAIWIDPRNGNDDVYAAYRPAGGPWSANVRVNDDTTNKSQFMSHVAVDGAGNAVAFWGDLRRDLADLYGAVHYRSGGWGPNGLLLNWSVSGAANRAGLLADSLSPAGPGNTSDESFQPDGGFAGNGANCGQQMAVAAVDAAGPAATFVENVEYVFEATASPGVDYANVYYVAPGGMASAAGLGPAQAGEGNHCHGGNGEEPPANNADNSSPDWPPGESYDVSITWVDGKPVWVVQGADGQSGAFGNRDDAVAFASQHAEPAGAQQGVQPPAEPPAQPPAQPPAEPPAQPPEEPPPGEITVTYVDDPSPPLTPELQAWMTASWLVYVSQDRPLTDAEKAELAAALQAMDPNSPNLQMLINQYQQNVAAQQTSQPQPQPAPTMTPTGQAPAGQPTPVPPGKQGQNLTQYYQNQYGTNALSGFVSWLTGSQPATEPVLPHSGEFVYDQTPLYIPGRGLDYMFRLSYHSQLVYDGPAGWGWEHNYDRRVIATGSGSLGRWDGAGHNTPLSFDGVNFTPPAGLYTAVVSATTGITLTGPAGVVEGFFPLDGSLIAGRLRSISDRNGNTLRFTYDAQGRLQTVTDTLGRPITYTYDANNRLAAVTDFASRVVRLTHDANGDLVGITTAAVTGTPNGNDFPQGKTTRFAYTSGFSDQRLDHNLTTVISPNEVADGSLTPREINTYGTTGLAFDRVVSQSWGGGRSNASGIPAGGNVTLVYTTTIAANDPPGAYSKTIITDRGGNVLELWHDGAGHRLRSRQDVAGQVVVYDYSYNADGQITGITYPAGNRLEASYDEAAANRLARGNLLAVRRVPDAARGCNGVGSTPCPALVTTYTYEPAFQRVATMTGPRGAVTTYSYDARGNLTQVAFPNVTVGPAAPQAASLSWTYNAWGQPLTFTNPEGAVTRYEYYTSGPSTGYRQRVVRDSGGLNVTTEYAYDAVGNGTSVTDGRGIRTDYVVNALNQVVKITRAAAVGGGQGSGVTSQDAHSAGGSTEVAIGNWQFAIPNPQSVPLDYATFYYYDANDNLVRVDVENVVPDLDADFHPTGSYSRDAANPWLTTTYTYDLLDNRVRQVAEVSTTASVTTEYRYDPLERLISLTLPAGNRVEYGYDERGQLRQVTRGAGTAEVATTSYAYDANGNWTHITDGEGHPTDYTYDGFDRRVGRVDALGNVVTWRRDAVGNVVETLVRDGQDGRNPGRTITAATAVTLTHTLNAFDERNRLYRQERQFFTADVATGVLTPITTDGDDDGWVETATTYDRNGNVTAVTNDKGQTTHYAYDGLGRLSLRTDALDNTTAYTYDGDNNLVQTVATERQPDGLAPAETFTVTCAYDAANRLVSTTDNPSTGSGQALGQASRYAYDSRGNLVFRSDANGPVTANGEWRMANSQSQIANNDHGNTALFAYDGLNRRLSETYHLRAGGLGNGAVTGQVTMTYVYDGNGNLVRRADPNGNETAYVYDPLDRLVRTAYASGTTATYAYDRASNLVRYTDANGSVITHTYDALDRRTRSDVARGLGMGGTTLQTFAWDGLSRLVAATDNNDPATPADDSTLAFTYDSLSNRRSETQNGRAVTHTYDGLGNRLSLTYPGGTALTYTYDELNRVETIADAGGAIATYDYIGPLRLLRRTNGNGTYAAYTYDSARRLTGLAYRLTSNQLLVTSFQYTYDRVGNRLTETAQPDNRQTTYTYDSLYRLVGAQFPAASFQYVYDPAGNRTQVVRDGQATAYTTNEMNEYRSVGGKSYTYDANGNLTLAGAQGYHYDFLGRLIESTPPLRLYLPLALRRGNGASVVAAGSQESAVPWARPAGTVSAYDALGRQAGKRTGSETVRYIYAGGVVIEERDGGGAVRATYVRDLVMQWGSTRIFYQADVLGSVRGLADTTGTVIERVAYDPFGTPIFSGGGSASAWGNPYLFRGARYDAARVLYVYGGRRYEPATGRYLQRGDETLGNPYTFAGNNPVRSTDR